MKQLLLLGAAALSPCLAAAQSHPLVGQWNVRVEMPLPPGSGPAATTQRPGQLVVTLVGDSLFATLQFEPMTGQPPAVPQRLAAATGAGPTTFVRSTEATLAGGGGDMMARTATISYQFYATGNALVGSMRIVVPGVPDIPPRPITGTRAIP
jgi:hypothetical protein